MFSKTRFKVQYQPVIKNRYYLSRLECEFIVFNCLKIIQCSDFFGLNLHVTQIDFKKFIWRLNCLKFIKVVACFKCNLCLYWYILWHLSFINFGWIQRGLTNQNHSVIRLKLPRQWQMLQTKTISFTLPHAIETF